MFARQLSPELLDGLPPTHPDAIANRRDLALINRWLQNFPWISRAARAHHRAGENVLELGAGEGQLAAHLHRANLPSDAIDLWPQPADWPAARRWWRDDLKTFSRYGEYPVVLGNLIFHQFSSEALGELGQQLRDARVIIACEPARWRSSQILFAVAARALAANPVTLHDGHVSIAGGFLQDELPLALGLARPEWSWKVHTTMRGVYRMIALRESQ